MISGNRGLIDALGFMALGGLCAEKMTGILLLRALPIGTGNARGDTTRYLPAMLAFMVGALLGGRLLRGPQKFQERRLGFAVEWLVVLAATLVAWFPEPDAPNLAGHGVVVMLALAMGIHNALVRAP